MNVSVKNLVTVPYGFTVLTRVAYQGELQWLSKQETGYDFLLAELADGSSALYRIYRNGSILPDRDSILVRDLNCQGRQDKIFAVEDADARPDQADYVCTACGQPLIIGKEGAFI
jgi:hypothetical protein